MSEFMKLTFHVPHYRLSPIGSKTLVVVNKHYSIVHIVYVPNQSDNGIQ